jgi:2-polyprenyl-6-methoxyphenol hydroxylase-like FAD-dependent oxidoreductase
LSAAVALEAAGVEPIVCERAGDLASSGSGLTLWPNATCALDHLGVLDDILASAAPMARMGMRTWRGDVIFEDDIEPPNGVRHVAIGMRRRQLVECLARSVRGSIALGTQVTAFRESADGVDVTIAGGKTLHADVLVGADGIHSAVRAQVASDDAARYAGYVVWRGIADGPFAGDTGCIWMGPGRQCGAFPVTGSCTYWFAACKASPAEAEALLTWSNARDSFSRWSHPIPHMIDATPEESIVRTAVYERAPLSRWSFGRVALLGDAAHPAAPTLGQGACQAIEDSVVLGLALSRHEDVPTALRSYESRRIRRANAFVLDARRAGSFGLWEHPVASWCRNAMMRMTPRRMRKRALAQMFEFAI